MSGTLYKKIKDLVAVYENANLPIDDDERKIFFKRAYSLKLALVYGYGDDADLPRLHCIERLPESLEAIMGYMKDLSDLTAHERGQLFGVVNARWQAWCKIVGGPAVAEELSYATLQLHVWDNDARSTQRTREVRPTELTLKPTKWQGRPPAGAIALSNAERQRRYRERRKAKQMAEGD